MTVIVRGTDTDRGLQRRQFIRTAAGSTAGFVLGGSALLAACTPSDEETGVGTRDTTDTTAVPPRTTSKGATETGATTDPPITGSPATATVWRLSTRNQRAPCTACKAHAAHRYFTSSQAADGGRAHPGCSCEVREQQTTATQLETWFAAGNTEVFDDRWQ